MAKAAYVYILASRPRGALYTGVTSNLAQRLHQHQQHLLPGFTSRYGVTRLVWLVHGEDIAAAITLEKKIKNRGRQWKFDLIEKENPNWDDLSASGSCDCAQDDGRAPRRIERIQEKAVLSSFTFRLADPVADRQALLDLNIAHVAWVFGEIEKASGVTARDILGMAIEDYVPTVIEKVCGEPPPRGAFYLVELDGQAMGMGGLRHCEDGIAEMKRVFVRPEARGHRLGEAIAARLVADARVFGYRRVRLDTMPFMGPAQALYERMGFVDCAPYPIEMPAAFRSGIRYMELAL